MWNQTWRQIYAARAAASRLGGGTRSGTCGRWRRSLWEQGWKSLNTFSMRGVLLHAFGRNAWPFRAMLFVDWTAGPISPMKRGLEQVPEDQEVGWKVHGKRMKQVCEQSMAVTKSNMSKCYLFWWLFPFGRNLPFGSNPYLRAIGSGSSYPSWKCLCVWETLYWLLSPSWSHMEILGQIGWVWEVFGWNLQ